MQASAGLRAASFSTSTNDADADDASVEVISFHSMLADPSSSKIMAAAFVPVAVAPLPIPRDIAELAAAAQTMRAAEAALDALDPRWDDEDVPPTQRDSGVFRKNDAL